MAQGKSFFDDVKKELECSVCQELFSEVNEPKILKCLHTFCKNCLEAWLRRQREGQLSCPTCRQITECSNSNIDSLPSNLFYKQMVEIVEAYSGTGQEADSPYCGNCEEKKHLKFYCFDCNTFLCDECAGTHSKWKSFKGHHVKEIGKFESSDVQDYARKSNVCKKHKDELRFYCENCNVCICRDCAILEHRDDRNHNIVSLEQGFENKKLDITSKMKDVEAIATRLRDQKQTSEKKRVRMLGSIDEATTEIHRVAEQWIRFIRQNESAMTKKLLEHKNSFQETFSVQMSSLDEKIVEIDNSLVFSSDVLARENLLEILNVEEILDKRFQDLSSEFRVNLNYPYVKYVPNDASSPMNDVLGELIFTNSLLTTANGKGLTEDLRRLREGPHTIDEKPLKVINQPPKKKVPLDPLKVHVQGLNEKTTKDSLWLYLEKFSKADVTEVYMGCNNNAMAVFGAEQDFVVLFDKVTKDRRGLEGKHVRLDRVPVCSCIKVKRHKETSDESIALYFANMRRSGGGPVSLVERIGKDQVLVHFENPSSVETVIKRSHVLERQQLDVKPYYPFLEN